MKRFTALFTALALLCIATISAQDYVCGDANYDSVANIDDGAYLFDYLVTGGPAPLLPDPAWANWDGHDGLTINDVFACKAFMDAGSYDPVCPVEGPLIPPTNGSVNYSNTIPALADHFAINLLTADRMHAFLFPLRVLVDGLPQAIDSIVVLPRTPADSILYKGARILPDPGLCVIGACRSFTGVWENRLVAVIYISFTPIATERTIELEWVNLSPAQAPEQDESLTPTYVYGSVYRPDLIDYCCAVPGDANSDGSCNLGDALFLVNYVFRSGPSPLCPAEADPNLDCLANLGDAVYIIDYAFRAGAAPICGCAE